MKVQAGAQPFIGLPEKKLDEVSQRLQNKSEQQMAGLREQLKQLQFAGLAIDMTREYSAAASDSDSESGEFFAWVGAECRNVPPGTVRDTLSLSADVLSPELVRFGYVERRREDRYLAETRVDLTIAGRKFEGTSRDISTLGMRVYVQNKVAVARGEKITVGLVSLQQKKSSANLMDIPYRVVNSRDEEKGVVLMLERILGGSKEGLKEFFVELISKNRHKLGVDTGDIRGAVESRIYESLLAINTPNIPFFIGCNTQGGAHLQFVGEPEAGSPLQAFFASADGQADYRCLNEPRIVTALYDAIQMLARQQRGSGQWPEPFGITVYLYKEYDELTNEVFIHAATELDFSGEAELQAFLATLQDYPDWCCLKVMSSFMEPLDDKTLSLSLIHI